MCSEQYCKVKRTFSDFDNSWEEEIESLKSYIQKTEKKILRPEYSRLTDQAKIRKEYDKSDNDSQYSSRRMDFYSSPAAPSRMLSAGGFCSNNSLDSACKDVIKGQKPKGSEECNVKWMSPSASRGRQPRREVFEDPFAGCPESSFEIDCGSSVISLDFGLVSPHRTWCSPPQRIERAQNREWSSPHRIIDRPNPENSPGNWISMKESCLPLRHSPALGAQYQPVETSYPEPDPRPQSQATYVLPDTAKSVETAPKVSQPTRKTCVLVDYEPDRVVFAKSKSGGSADLQPSNEKIRRIDDSSNHVVKVSLLGDFEAPPFGKTHEKTTETTEKEKNTENADKLTRTNKTTKIACKLSPSGTKPQAKKMKKEEPKEEGGTSVRVQSTIETAKSTVENVENGDAEEEGTTKENRIDDVSKSTQKMIQDLEKILRPSDREGGKIISQTTKEKSQGGKPKINKMKPRPKVIEEKPLEIPEKRKRNVDPKAVQEYIKSQKHKRMEQVKTEKKTKDAEKEAIKKKLENLRITTLKLATQSKKKKASQPTIKVVDPGTEDDVTMSLGLKQIKPKVSYNESVSKMKKNALQQKLQLGPVESETVDLPAEKSGSEENCEKTLEDLDTIQHEKFDGEISELSLKKPNDAVEAKGTDDLNAALKKLAETLHLKLEKKEKQFRSRPGSLASKSAKDPLSQVPSQETLRSAKTVPEENRQMVAVDLETIQTLKSDIKKISENFKILHEIILDKEELSGKASAKKQESVSKSPILLREEPKEPKEPIQPIQAIQPIEPIEPKELKELKEPKESYEWFRSVVPRPYPYNVLTAFQKKMNIRVTKTPSSVSQGSSTFAEPISNKYESEFEALSMPSDRLCSSKELISGKDTSHCTSEANYFSMKEDSGSELSSSILDSEKQSWEKNQFETQSTSSSKSSSPSSIATEISSSIHLATSRPASSIHSNQSKRSFGREREDLILVTPDLKLISNDLNQDKFDNYTKNLNVEDICKTVEREELNNSEKSYKEQKSDSTITEIIDNLSENEKSVKSVKSTNEKAQNLIRRVEEVPHSSSLVRRTFFQPEMLHLQFQAELTLLETFQKSLSHFLEAERMKTLSEVNKIVYEKAMNTDKAVEKEDQAVQTSCIRESPERTASEETVSVETEIAVEESSKREKPESEKIDLISVVSEKINSYAENANSEKETQEKEVTSPDFCSTPVGVSFDMLNRMMKDEELRSEHQLALIRLREKTSNEKVKAELTFLEMKKRSLKERGGDVELSISAIKKKQRGILLKYQSEKEEIERLKKMHRLASEERKIMIKQQKQIQQMQMSTKDMIIKLKKRERSPSKKTPLKPKALRSFDSESEIREDIPIVSDSMLSDSIYSAEESARHSTCTDLELSSRSNMSDEENEILKRNKKTLQSKMSHSLENFKSKKLLLEVEKYPRKRHSVEELLSWTRRLEEKENHLKELEKQAMSAANRAKRLKSLKSVKISMKDRSTSPFQFQDSTKTISEVSPSNGTEVQKSSTISEAVESNLKTETTKSELVVEKVQSSASEDIPEQFSKKISTSKTTEYCSESFESPSSSEAPKTKPEVARLKYLDGNHRAIAIKLSLSPRMQSPRRRYSSGSDDSVNLSHTETASEQSDLESRIAALHEQLRRRKLEAERLRREQKKAQRERLKVKEQSLLKQIQAYDAYIQKKKQELEQEYERSTQTVMKPLIKQPKVAEKASLKRQELQMTNDSEKPMLSARLGSKNKEEAVEKMIESDSEVLEQMKEDSSESIKEFLETSESIKEQTDSKVEKSDEKEEEKSIAASVLDAESFMKENHSIIKSTSLSESYLEQDASQSESEDQSISIKTTLYSPERDTEKADTVTTGETCGEESQNKQSLDEDVYQFDSFESDAEEKVVGENEGTQKDSGGSEVGTEIPSELTEVAEEEKESQVQDEEEREESAEVEITEDPIHKTVQETETETQNEKVEEITDSIMIGLILESLNVFYGKKAAAERKIAEESKLSLEALSSLLAREIISEAVDDMLGIYNRKRTPEEVSLSSDRITSEIRKRVSEIMSQAEGTRETKRPQDMMITTYDISPVVSPPGDLNGDAAEREKFLQKLSPPKTGRESKEESYPEGDEESSQMLKAETYGQQWIDDDYGLSRTRREAEELRLQQLQIEQEIQQLQEQQEQVPYFYLREIPNKPPPPYTPPGKPLAEIPTSESEVTAITLNAVRILTEEMAKGTQIADIEPTWGYYEEAASEQLKCYKLFLFELSKYIISELIDQQESKEEDLPWMRTREHLSKYKYRKVERTVECLSDFVRKQVSILFGFGKKVSKESMIVKWIKKKRDHVDEILVGESQEEEAQWTQYDEDQVTVKNEITLAILDNLLEDTGKVFDSIFNNKRQKMNRNEVNENRDVVAECHKTKT